MLNSPIDKYAETHSTPESALLQELAEYTRANITGAQMLCGRVEGELLRWLVGLVRAERVLELGTYTGYSALSMAEALPDSGRLITCDKNADVLAVAQQFIARSAQGHKIQVVERDIMDLLQDLLQENAVFDFIFIDANKKPNKEYVEKCLQLLSPAGMIAVDNTLFQEKVLHPVDELSKVIAEFNESLVKRTDLEVLLLPVRDGITLIRRKK
jgi:caffeoyl-CoA O-methyltransferase